MDDELNELKYMNERLKDRNKLLEGLLEELEERETGTTITAKRDIEAERTIASLQRQVSHDAEHIKSLNDKIAELQLTIQAIKKRADDLEEAAAIENYDPNVSVIESQLEARNQALADAKVELTVQQNTILQLTLKVEECVQQNKALASELQQLNEDLVAAKVQKEEMFERVQELEFEISNKEQCDMMNRGNNIFAEFANERVKLESDLVNMHTELQKQKQLNLKLTLELQTAKTQNQLFDSMNGNSMGNCICHELKKELERERAAKLEAQQRIANFHVLELRKLSSERAMTIMSSELDRAYQQVSEMEKELHKLRIEVAEKTSRVAFLDEESKKRDAKCRRLITIIEEQKEMISKLISNPDTEQQPSTSSAQSAKETTSATSVASASRLAGRKRRPSSKSAIEHQPQRTKEAETEAESERVAQLARQHQERLKLAHAKRTATFLPTLAATYNSFAKKP